MKQSSLLICTVLALTPMTGGAMGAACSQSTQCLGTAGSTGATNGNCKTETLGCFDLKGTIGLTYVRSCTTCTSPRVFTQHTIHGICDMDYNTCECPNCKDSLTVVSTGYLKVITCDSICNAHTSYKCDTGYFGKTTNGTSGCTKCPTGDSNMSRCGDGQLCCKKGYYPDTAAGKCTQCPRVNGSSSPQTTTVNCIGITACYLPAGGYTDETGTFSLTGNCYWQE